MACSDGEDADGNGTSDTAAWRKAPGLWRNSRISSAKTPIASLHRARNAPAHPVDLRKRARRALRHREYARCPGSTSSTSRPTRRPGRVGTPSLPSLTLDADGPCPAAADAHRARRDQLGRTTQGVSRARKQEWNERRRGNAPEAKIRVDGRWMRMDVQNAARQAPHIMELIAGAPWREAVTFRETWPHEYVVVNRDGQQALLAAFCDRSGRTHTGHHQTIVGVLRREAARAERDSCRVPEAEATGRRRRQEIVGARSVEELGVSVLGDAVRREAAHRRVRLVLYLWTSQGSRGTLCTMGTGPEETDEPEHAEDLELSAGHADRPGPTGEISDGKRRHLSTRYSEERGTCRAVRGIGEIAPPQIGPVVRSRRRLRADRTLLQVPRLRSAGTTASRRR